jgi:phosphatidylinositol alpha-1,6-mannosyltransferase
MRHKLVRLAQHLQVTDDVVFAGAVPWAELPPYMAAGDVFCMPCRTRKLGFEVEGLGIVYLEASATGLPVVAGNSGGAPDAVIRDQTGVVIDGRSINTLSACVSALLLEPDRSRVMGERGREWAKNAWAWPHAAGILSLQLSA